MCNGSQIPIVSRFQKSLKHGLSFCNIIVTMQEETLLTSPLARSGYLPVSTYPNLDDNNNNKLIFLHISKSQVLQMFCLKHHVYNTL